MNQWQIIAWILVLVASIVGLASRDWRWFGGTLFGALLALAFSYFFRK